jgi:hypothetical protein
MALESYIGQGNGERRVKRLKLVFTVQMKVYMLKSQVKSLHHILGPEFKM